MGFFLSGIPAEEGQADQIMGFPADLHGKGAGQGAFFTEHQPFKLVDTPDVSLFQPIVNRFAVGEFELGCNFSHGDAGILLDQCCHLG